MEKSPATDKKGAQKSRKVRLKSREHEVLYTLEYWGILGLGQLEGLLFGQSLGHEARMPLLFNEYDRSVFDRYCYKRLQRLETAGFIQRLSYLRMRGPGLAYALTKSGQTVLDKAKISQKVGLRRTWSSRFIQLHLRANAVGLVLEKVLRAPVHGRHRLSSQARSQGANEHRLLETLPDLRVGRRVSFPLVVGHPWRYQRNRSLLESGESLLYLGTKSERETLLYHTINRRKSAHIYLGDLDEFRGKLQDTVFTNPAGKTVTLGHAIERIAAAQGGGWTGF